MSKQVSFLQITSSIPKTALFSWLLPRPEQGGLGSGLENIEGAIEREVSFKSA